MFQKDGLAYNLIAFSGKKIIRILEWIITRFVSNSPVFEPVKFGWTKKFENNINLIRNEYITIAKKFKLSDISEISAEQQIVVDRNKWTFFPLYIYGNKIEHNLTSCPATAKLLEEIPNLTTAFFSVLLPGARVKQHRGAFKGYLRYHLGVNIPQPTTSCGIKIDNKTYYWENGSSLIFDDTFLHEAWNKSNMERVVLYVDFIRPMPKVLVCISKGLTKMISASPYIQNSLAKIKIKQYDPSIKAIIG